MVSKESLRSSPLDEISLSKEKVNGIFIANIHVPSTSARSNSIQRAVALDAEMGYHTA